jgi:hypothetical protein
MRSVCIIGRTLDFIIKHYARAQARAHYVCSWGQSGLSCLTDDLANGRSLAGLSDLMSQISEDIPGKLTYMVGRFEKCRDDGEIPGRPHIHIYLEFSRRVSESQVFLYLVLVMLEYQCNGV